MSSERLLDPIFYLLFVGWAEAFVVGVLALCALAFTPRLGWSWYLRFVRRAASFAGLLLVLGLVANSAWMHIAYGRWYVSADTVVDFWPFVPFGQWVLEQEFGTVRGRLLGAVSVPQLQLLWLALSSAVWVSAWLAYRRVFRRAA